MMFEDVVYLYYSMTKIKGSVQRKKRVENGSLESSPKVSN